MSRLIFDASTLGGTTTLSSEDAVGDFTIDVPAVTGTLLIPATVGLANQVLTSNATTAPTWTYLTGTGTVTSVSGSGGTTGLTLTGGPITTSGTLTLGGTLIAVNGGTGQSSYVVGDVLYASTTTALSKLTIGTTGQVLTVTAGIPSWATPTTGTVTSVTGTAPVVSSGGNTPAISMAAATTSVNGYLTSTDWTTFNNKGSVTSVAGTGTVNGLTLTGTVTTSGSLTLGGTLSLVSPPAIGTTTPAEVKATTGWAANFALTDAATIAWNTATSQVATFTFVSTNRTFGAPTNLKDGAFYALAVIQNAGSNTITWNAVFKWAAGVAPTLSTAASAKDFFTFRSDGTNLYQQGISQAVA